MPQTVSIHHRDATLPRTFLHHLVLPLPAAASPLLPPPPQTDGDGEESDNATQAAEVGWGVGNERRGQKKAVN